MPPAATGALPANASSAGVVALGSVAAGCIGALLVGGSKAVAARAMLGQESVSMMEASPPLDSLLSTPVINMMPLSGGCSTLVCVQQERNN